MEAIVLPRNKPLLGRGGRGRKGLGIGREEKEVREWSREGREGRGTDGMKMSVTFIQKLPLHRCQ